MKLAIVYNFNDTQHHINKMKRMLIPRIYILILLCGAFLSAQAQNFKFDGLAGKKVISVIENISTPITTVGDSGAGGNQPAISGPAKTEKATWETTFSATNATKKLKRITFSVLGPGGLEKYDSDNSFESTDGAENWVKKFIKIIGKPSVRNLETGGPNSKPSADGDNTDNVWNADLPPYEPSLYWNGLVVQFPLKLEKNITWKTELKLAYGVVQNEYTIVETSTDSLKIKMQCKVIYNDTDKGTLNANGAPAGMSFGLQRKQRTFDGFIFIDRRSMLILKGTFQIETVSVLNINGSGSEKKAYSTTTITNSITK